MRLPRALLLFTLLLPLQRLGAQELLSVGFYGGSTSINIGRIDPVTGAATVLVTTDATALSSAEAALDAAGQRVFFQTSNQLYTVNLAANTFSKVTEPNCCGQLLYDAVGGQLLGVGFYNGSTHVNVARIDPVTGAATVLATTDATAISSAQSALDTFGRRVFFQLPNQLYTVNLAASTFSKVAESSCCAPLLYDSLHARLLGTGFFNGSSAVNVARVDPATGAATVLVTTDATAFSSAEMALDASGQRIFFQVPNQLYTVNYGSATFSRVAMPQCCGDLLFAPPSTSIPMLSAPVLLLLLVALSFCGAFNLTGAWLSTSTS